MINSSHEIWRGSASVFSVPTARISHSSDAPEEMGTPVKRRGRPPGSRNKNTLAKEAARGPATSVKPVTTPAAGDRAVVAQKRKRDEYECDVVTFLRRGGISILEALAVKLPDVFAAEILPKLDVNDTLRLAQVNKAYNDTVWSVEGMRSMKAKIKPHVLKIGKKVLITEPYYWAASHGNVSAVRACLESGVDVDKVLTADNRTALHVAAFHGRAALVKALIEAGADVNRPASPRTKGGDPLHDVTPLYFAAQEGHTHVVMELIKAGADVNLATSGGFTPLYIAAQKGHEGCVALLIQAGADARKADKDGNTPMKVATRNKREKIMTLSTSEFRIPSRRSMKRHHRVVTNHHAPSLSTYPHAASASRPRFADATNAPGSSPSEPNSLKRH